MERKEEKMERKKKKKKKKEERKKEERKKERKKESRGILLRCRRVCHECTLCNERVQPRTSQVSLTFLRQIIIKLEQGIALQQLEDLQRKKKTVRKRTERRKERKIVLPGLDAPCFH